MRSSSSFYMNRKAADFWGHDWPKDQAMIARGVPLTWSEIHRQRRERQEEELADKRESEGPRIVPAYVWTFLIPDFPYGGWWCYLTSMSRGWREANSTAPKGEIEWGGLSESIMRAFPMGLLPSEENWPKWMVALAQRRPRRTSQDTREAGSLVGWHDRGAERFSLQRQEEE